jgi:uncharacterized membrane protein YphA (DoxX/SURF4 family)
MKLENYSKEILRIGTTLVYLWFGFFQLINPSSWIGYLPSWVYSLGVETIYFIYLNGIIEVALGLFLLIGFKVRISALLLTIHMSLIMIHLGYNDILIRDFGILIATFVVYLNGKDKLCLENRNT